MAISMAEGSSAQTFDRHIKRLGWCALLGSLALLVPLVRASSSPEFGLTETLGAIVVMVAVLDVVRDVGRYVRTETTRRREAAKASQIVGACHAADAIQDRVANLLSVTVGYAHFLSEDDNLPRDAREHAQRALDSALAAARVVSAFRQSLHCESEIPLDASQLKMLQREAQVAAAETRNARLIAETPALWAVLSDTQRLAIDLLASPRGQAEEVRIRQLLERLNDVTQRLEPD